MPARRSLIFAFTLSCLCCLFGTLFGYPDDLDVISLSQYCRSYFLESSNTTGYRFLAQHLAFYGLMNERGKFFLPYKDIVIGGLRFEKLLMATGSSGLNLAFGSTEDIDTVLRAYPSPKFSWRFHRATMGNSYTFVLAIEQYDKYVFPFTLDGNEILRLNSLRFQLCQEDASYILKNYKSFIRLENYIKILSNPDKFSATRSVNNLIGQSILKHYMCIQIYEANMCFDTAIQRSSTPFTTEDLHELERALNPRPFNEDATNADFEWWTMELVPELSENIHEDVARLCSRYPECNVSNEESENDELFCCK